MTKIKVKVNSSDTTPKEFEVDKGVLLRDALLQNGISPYTKFTSKWNCGGRGLCATCGVFILNKNINPYHWHDWLAKKFYYPRLSCQVKVMEDMEIEIPEKWIWGKRRREG